MVNSTPEFDQQHLVINGFSDLIINIFGQDIGRHARSAIGVSGLPMNFAIEIEAEIKII
jgi:enamine deaminase RidA (YjgF/YER057c/UK114 family)